MLNRGSLLSRTAACMGIVLLIACSVEPQSAVGQDAEPTEPDSPSEPEEQTTPESTAPLQEPVRAIWVWQSEVVTNPDAKAEFIQFTAQKNLNTAYLSTYDILLVSGNQQPLRDFIASSGLQVELLAGQPSWAFSEQHGEALNFVESAVQFSQTLPAGSTLVGVHLDIEPYIFAAWEADQQAVIAQYLDLLSAAQQMVHGTGLVLTVDIPLWFDTISATYNGEERPLSEHVQMLSDRVVVLAYRDIAAGDDGIISNASSELDSASAIGSNVVIGVETVELFSDSLGLTFFDEGEAAMLSQLDAVRNAYQSNPAYAGTAIHDYLGYASLANYPTVFDNRTPDTCTPVGGSQPPSSCIANISIAVNGEPPQVVGIEENLELAAGDTLQIVNLRYCSDGDAAADSIQSEAYLFANFEEDYTSGRFSNGTDGITSGCFDTGQFASSAGSADGWTLATGQHRLAVSLVHYYPGGFEEESRDFININVTE